MDHKSIIHLMKQVAMGWGYAVQRELRKIRVSHLLLRFAELLADSSYVTQVSRGKPSEG